MSSHCTVVEFNKYKREQEAIIATLTARLDKLQTDNDALRGTNKLLEEKLQPDKLLENGKKLFSDLLKVSEKKNLSEPLLNVINLINDNDDEKKKREKNLIIFGLKITENEDVKVVVNNLLNKLNNTNKKQDNIFRMIKRGETNDLAPIKIIVEDIKDKFSILKSAKNLRQINIDKSSRISISMDQTVIERQRFNALNSQRKLSNDENKLNNTNNNTITTFYYGIRNNNLRKIYHNQTPNT